MKSLLPLRLERDKLSMVLDTGQHVRCFQEKQVQQLKETCSDLNCSGRRVVKIQRSNDRKRMVLNPGMNLTPGASKFYVQHQGLGREAGHVVIDKVRCLCEYLSRLRRFWSEQNPDLYRCSITKMVNFSLCVVAVEPRLACLNRFPSCSSAESTSFFIHGSAWRR